MKTKQLKKLKWLSMLALACLLGSGSAGADERPNILVIMCDDLGYGDLGYTGSKEIRTPNLDRLAANGIECRNGYTTHPYCGPSRSGFITGRYQARFGMEVNLTNSHFDMYSGVPLTEQTFATRLQKSGYRTGVVGKWHLGASFPFHPNNRGFDYFYGFLSGGHSYFPEDVTTTKPLLLDNGEPHYSANEGSCWPLMRNNNTAEFKDYLTRELSRDAARFVSKSGDEPFLLYLAYNAPHKPLEAPEETIAKYSNIKNKNRRIYAAMVDEMDQGIGVVLDALKESGKYENTLIFFFSDNGGSGAHNPGNFSTSGPFKGGKGSMHEGGCHVPFIVHWPAGLPEAGKFDGLVSALDVAATSVALGKGDTSGSPLEGVNLIPYLRGEKKGSPHEALFWRMQDGVAWSVRTVDTKFLLEQKKYGGKVPVLYDMANDPYESTDIADAAPERRATMAKLWNDWNSQNMGNIWLQSGGYQKWRLRMYEELYEKLEKEAAKKKPIVIE
ncbi:sulfatase family protein [Pelagicoccus mobilis]|uniref:Sulfatase-like hydrolase/transferase n=1 Tax=Pelagicoccus mobilis TaxID=415221 RepID=A0A934RYQ5_9BACT|nr:sulfatase-like hydrolase/transferase [Pelagicoccus mobilis]MBK1877709.1 sulfatase-like hydrolase/transferase [Pelagicoccus mobilis]